MKYYNILYTRGGRHTHMGRGDTSTRGDGPMYKRGMEKGTKYVTEGWYGCDGM